MLILASLAIGQGCALLLPAGHGDMESRLKSLPLPPGFLYLNREQGGLRTHFAGASAPRVAHTYAAPWGDGALCDQLRDLVSSVGTLNLEMLARDQQSERLNRESGFLGPDDHGCSFEATIESGWRGKLLGVWSYRLHVYAANAKLAVKFSSQSNCDRLRRQGYRIGNLPWWLSASGECFLPPGHGFVRLTVIGSQI